MKKKYPEEFKIEVAKAASGEWRVESGLRPPFS